MTITEMNSKLESLVQARENAYSKMNETSAAGDTAAYDAAYREYNNAKAGIETVQSQISFARESAVKPSVIAKIREAIQNKERSVTVQGYTSSGTTVAGVHDQVINEDIQGILDPLYTNSVLSKLGVRFFGGLTHGDVKVPIMTKNTVGWEGEIDAAAASQPGFSAVTLKPKRLAAYVDISRQLLLQDNNGAEQAILRDLSKAVADKLEETIFGYAAGTSEKPKGMFWDDTLDTPAVRTLSNANSFANVVKVEGGLEDNCVNLANCKYLLSPKAKATLRTMATNGNGSPRVLTGDTIDGTPALVSANVVPSNAGTEGAYIYGDWSNLAVGSWGDVTIGIYDDSQTATAGVIRLVVNAYFDAKVLRENCFTYGDVRHA